MTQSGHEAVFDDHMFFFVLQVGCAHLAVVPHLNRRTADTAPIDYHFGVYQTGEV